MYDNSQAGEGVAFREWGPVMVILVEDGGTYYVTDGTFKQEISTEQALSFRDIHRPTERQLARAALQAGVPLSDMTDPTVATFGGREYVCWRT